MKTSSFAAVSVTSFAVLALAPLSATPAAAHIVCQGDFQKVQGDWIATPYCSDRHIARYARREGENVTGRQVRRNSLLKDELCQGSPGLAASCGMGGDEE